MGIPRPRVKLNNIVTADVRPIQIVGGVNTAADPFNIDISEAVDSRNTSTRKGNVLSARQVRTIYSTAITTPNAAGVYNNTSLHVVSGTTWKKWNGATYDTVATVTSALAKFLEFNTAAKRYMLMFNGTDKKAWDGSTVTDLTEAPATNIIACDDIRLYALLGSIFKCTAAHSVTDWTTNLDADSKPLTGMIGAGTAIVCHNGLKICFSEQSMIIVRGNDPYDFSASEPMNVGCVSQKSIAKDSKGYLYFLDKGKYRKFLSGASVDISQKVKTYLEGIPTAYRSLSVAGTHGKYIYLSIPFGAVTVNNITLEYDTDRDTWSIWNEGYKDFFNIGNDFFGVTPTGAVHKLCQEPTTAVQVIDAPYYYHNVTEDIISGTNAWNPNFTATSIVTITGNTTYTANNGTFTIKEYINGSNISFPFNSFTEGTEQSHAVTFTKVNEVVTWYHITGMMFNNFHRVSVDSIPIVVNLPTGSTLKVACNTNFNSPSWTDIYTLTASVDMQDLKIEVPIASLDDVDYFQLKFYGTGACDIYFMGLDKRISER